MDTLLGRDRLREFIDLILASLDEDIDGYGIASRGCLSRYHFDRLVSSALGESPGAFRRRLLLERAAWELRGRQATITRVAFGAGYRSCEGFTRAFSRAFGVTPGRYRNAGGGFQVDAPNGVHFHPPGGISIPGPHEQRGMHMDFVDRIVGHDIWFTERLLERAEALPEGALDQPMTQGWSFRTYEKNGPTLRALLNEMVANKENWSAALSGQSAPRSDGQSIEELKARLGIAGREFSRLIRTIKDRGDWDAGFVDAVCDPPESFTYGGMLAHVVTFSAVRRMRAIAAFRDLGIDDLGFGDPIEWERSLS